jgi:uncharacterized protein YegJ (DUF2314 family)
VRKGDVVKLIFEIAVPYSEEFGSICGERMWVEVTQRAAPYIVGILANQPLSFGETDVLKQGDEIVFLPEHIIDFYPKHLLPEGGRRKAELMRAGVIARP